MYITRKDPPITALKLEQGRDTTSEIKNIFYNFCKIFHNFYIFQKRNEIVICFSVCMFLHVCLHDNSRRLCYRKLKFEVQMIMIIVYLAI